MENDINEIYEPIIKVLNKEIKLYTDFNNPDWTKEKNKGFIEGIKYCRYLLTKMQMVENTSISDINIGEALSSTFDRYNNEINKF